MTAVGAIAAGSDGQLSLSGMVVNAVTGAPVPYARVALAPTGGETQTDATGAFQFSHLESGPYLIAARKQGFVSSEMGETLELTESRDKYVLKLTPFSAIKGRVVDGSGDPVEHATVLALESKVEGGRRGNHMVKAVETDDRGQYRIAGLGAGSYLIQVSPPAFRNGYYGKDDPQSADRESFAPVFFGGSKDPDQATKIAVTAGAEMRADVRLEMQPGHTVRGRIEGFRAHVAPVLQLSSGEHDPGFNASAVEYSTGRFAIRGVPNGSYRLRIYQNGEGEQVLFGERNIDVAGRDVEDVAVALAVAPTLHGTLRTEGADVQESRFGVVLAPQDPLLAMDESRGARTSGEVKDGHFEIDGVIPGKYWIFLVSEFSEGYIASARAGEVDLLASQELLVGHGGAPEIEVVQRKDYGTVTGTLSPETASLTDALLLLAPEGCNRPAQVTLPNLGAFTFSHVPPGKYRLHAWKNVDNVEYGSREVVCALGRDGIPVEVAPGAEVKVDLPKLTEESK